MMCWLRVMLLTLGLSREVRWEGMWFLREVSMASALVGIEKQGERING